MAFIVPKPMLSSHLQCPQDMQCGKLVVCAISASFSLKSRFTKSNAKDIENKTNDCYFCIVYITIGGTRWKSLEWI